MSTTTDARPARLVLSTGEIFQGRAFGATDPDLDARGEVVFNTAMSGYQESLSDPSYAGQILVQTAPMVGVTGMNPIDMESSSICVRGFVVHEHVDRSSNYRATQTLDEALREARVAGISGIDTRALTRVLRTRGVTVGLISSDPALSDEQLIEQARSIPSMEGSDLASGIGVCEARDWTKQSQGWPVLDDGGQESVRVGVLDCGTKGNIPEMLAQCGAAPVLLPMDTDSSTIKQMASDGSIKGLMISNGPGDPSTLTDVIETVRALIEDPELERFPIYGICLGHQILALAHGAKTYKLKFGHRGINHPIHDTRSGRVVITSQNHGFAVDPDSIQDDRVRIDAIHLNDQTVGGLSRTDRPIRSVQFHPEASPGPHDASTFFVEFVRATHGTENLTGV